jgi:hypothetical protein
MGSAAKPKSHAYSLFFTDLSDLPFTLPRLEHRPWTFTSFTLAPGSTQL